MTATMILALLMMAVTLPSRVLPSFFLGGKKLPPLAEALFGYIPYAILGALIFPDVITSTGNILTSTAGAAVALILSWLGMKPLTVLAGGIAATFLVGQIF